MKMPVLYRALLLVAASALPLTGALAHSSGGHHGAAHAVMAKIASPAEATKATRTIEITLSDLAVAPEAVQVKAGETVRFIVRNTGALLHTFEVGSPEQQFVAQDHTAMMLDHGMITDTAIVADQMAMSHEGHDMGHEAMTTLLVEPGATAEATWHFAQAGTIEIACSMPGHYEAGMAGRLDVTR